MAIRTLGAIILGAALALGCDEASKPIVGPKTDDPETRRMYEHRPEYRETFEDTENSISYEIEQDIFEGEPRWAYTFFRGDRQLETITVCGSDAKDLVDGHRGPLYDFMKTLDRLDATDGEITEQAVRAYEE